MMTMLEYPISTIDGPDPEDMQPDLELPRCLHCGHEITTSPVIRLFHESDPDAMWSICDDCIAHGRISPPSEVNQCPS